ncbi:MAG TPA: bestrophin family ion channel [Saprospiraceae bacterium]|nr:bestrophin family ion channel [Saprospiraceae bacterium]
MDTYNSKDWIRPIIYFHKSDTFRKLLWFLVCIGVFTGIIAYLELEYFKLGEKSYVRNIPIMHNLLGFAISMLLVFRTNTAYDRWWEGRKLWGTLVNISRNFAIKVNNYLPTADLNNRQFFKQLIVAFPESLHKHLQLEKTRLELDEDAHPEIPDFYDSHHAPMQIVDTMQKKISQLYNQKIIDGYQLMILDKEVATYMDICGACERIKNTPIPFTYSSFIKKFIFIYTFTLPFGFAFTLGYFAIPIVMFIFYVLASLELIAEEIEEPFGKDVNDLPMGKMSLTIKKSVTGIL